jgi:soluble lytic murein transglycosylase-like protein
MGLMQLMPATAREYKVRNAYDPAANIDAGVQKLKGLLDTLQGRRAGARGLQRRRSGRHEVQRHPPYRETQNYVRRSSRSPGCVKSVKSSAQRPASRS